MIYYWN